MAVANYNYRKAMTSVDGDIMDLPAALDAADTWQKYCDIAIFFSEDGKSYIDAPANALVMSGYYVSQKEVSHPGRPPMGTLDIQSGLSSPDGVIHLSRVISQVNFDITYNTHNIKSFRVNWWEVSNVPTNCWLHERTAGEITDGTIESDDTDKPLNSFDTRKVKDGFNNSGHNTTVSQTDNKISFDFWMLENKRTGRIADTSGDPADVYRKREQEYKNKDDGTNSGKYVSLVDAIDSTDPNNNATFVTFHVTMEMSVDSLGNSLTGTNRRLVEADYVVHLGYIDNNANDFNCFRNSIYTYNIKINNVKDLLVEAHRQGEPNPATDGDITDISDAYYDLDAHYSLMNVYLSNDDLSNFQYYISAPSLNGAEVIIDSQVSESVPKSTDDNYKYLSWVELRRSGDNASVLAAYKPRSGTNSDSQTYTLDEFKSLADDGKLSPGYYTVFINEYVYETTDNALNGDESESTNWKNYVNREPRRMWLLVQRGISEDTENKHFSSKLAVSQKSIQCYYDVNHAGLTSAIGLEHTNETLGLTLRNTFNPRRNTSGDNYDLSTSAGRNAAAGRYNIAQYIAGSTGTSLSWNTDPEVYTRWGQTYGDTEYLWSTYLNINSLQSIPAVNKQGVSLSDRTEQLPQIKTQSISEYGLSNALQAYEPSSSIIQAISACLGRNRDLDGDGFIDANELRWFVPTSDQYVRMILGRQALDDPLLDPKGITKLNSSNNGYNTRLMFYASNGKFLWAMEGTSVGEYRQTYTNQSTPWEVRCARNLGSNMTAINSTAANTPAFQLVAGKNIIDMTRYDNRALRTEPIRDGSLPSHHVNDQQYNRPYHAFEYKDEVITLSDYNNNFSSNSNNPFYKNTDNKIDSKESWSTYISRVNPCDVYNINGEKGWRLPNQKEQAIMAILCHNKGGATYQVGCTFSYFDNDGYVPGQNPNNKAGAITSQFHHEMKIRSSDGAGTQWGNLTNNIYGTISDGVGNSGTMSFRCVRDYTGAL